MDVPTILILFLVFATIVYLIVIVEAITDKKIIKLKDGSGEKEKREEAQEEEKPSWPPEEEET